MGLHIKNAGYCPRCLRTAQWDNNEVMTCDWCDETFIYDDVWDEFRDIDDRIIEREASIFLDRLIEIARTRYNTDVVHLNRQQQKNVFREGQRGRFAIEEKQLWILIDGFADELERIIILSHELGHAANFHNDYNRDRDLFESHYNDPAGRMRREQSAWRYAVQLLKEVGFTRWEDFLSITSYSIGSYYETVWEPYKSWFIKEYNQEPVQFFPDKEEFLKSLV